MVETVEALARRSCACDGDQRVALFAGRGFDGCYAWMTRALRRVRGPQFSAPQRVSVPIHADPGEEAHFDLRTLDGAARR